jgi:hypothetical protein
VVGAEYQVMSNRCSFEEANLRDGFTQ